VDTADDEGVNSAEADGEATRVYTIKRDPYSAPRMGAVYQPALLPRGDTW